MAADDALESNGSIRRDLARKGNAFDVIRLVAALFVVCSHSFAVLGLPEPHPVGSTTLGTIGVYVFFVTSGYLITKSWLDSSSVLSYTTKRLLRIYPGYIVAVCICALALGPLVTTRSAIEYLSDPLTWKYIRVNAGFTAHVDRLPGVFSDLPYSNAVNGSLWSLRYELLMYLVVLLVGLIASRVRWSQAANALCHSLIALVLLAVFLGFSVGMLSDTSAPIPLLWRTGITYDLRTLSTFGAYFFMGALLFQFRRRVRLHVGIAIGLVVALAVFPAGAVADVGLMMALPYIVITAAFRAPAWLRSSHRQIDLSYGIYLYSFPIQQTLVHLFHPGPEMHLITLVAEVAISCCAAFASWKLVEKPALRMKAAVMSREVV